MTVDPKCLKGRVHLQDTYGNRIRFGRIGDMLMPDFPSIPDFYQHRTNIQEMDLKPDDVIIVGYPKTGNHWAYEVVSMLMAGSPTYCSSGHHSGFIDRLPSVSNPPDSAPRVFTSHFLLRHFPKQVWEKKPKIVYLQRNPKDTWVSLYNHSSSMAKELSTSYDGTWNQFFDLIISFGYWYGDWFEYVRDWEREIEANTDLEIFTSEFETLKRDPVGQIEKLDKFLGYNRSRQLLEEIADACSFTKLKTFRDSTGTASKIKTKLFQPGAAGFYRKGEVGDWKNWFTVAQNELFDDVYSKRMVGSKLRYTFV